MSTQALESAATAKPTRLPMRPVTRLAPAAVEVDSVGPRSAAHRVAYRLTGSSRRASAIADEAVNAAATARRADARLGTIATAVGVAIEAVLATADAVITADVDNDPFAQHRTRLRRDLARWPRTSRLTLALRHLVGMSPALVAEVLGRDVADVREITRHWSPEDSTFDQVIDLRDYGRLFGRVQETDPAPERPSDPLEHLDRPVV